MAYFAPDAPGKFVAILYIRFRSHAFIPAPLPVSDKVLSPNVAKALSTADAELGRLDRLASNLPDPEILIGPFFGREAILSSRIERTRTTFSDLVLFEANDDHEMDADIREVTIYNEALKYGVRRIKEISMSRQLLLETHAMLMAARIRKSCPEKFAIVRCLSHPPDSPSYRSLDKLRQSAGNGFDSRWRYQSQPYVGLLMTLGRCGRHSVAVRCQLGFPTSFSMR